VGVFVAGQPCPPARELIESLAALGWIEGRTLAFDCVPAVRRFEEMPGLAASLVARKPDVIVAGAIPTVRSLLAASPTVPIVAMALADPVGQRFAQSLSRPGGSVTGLVSVMLDVEEKRVDLLKEISPSLSRLAVVFRRGADEQYRATVEQMLARTGRRHGFTYEWAYHERYQDIPQLIGDLAAKRFDAAYLVPSPYYTDAKNNAPLAEAARKRRVAIFGQDAELAEAGALFAYGPDRRHVAQRTAGYVDKILRGAAPGDLPFEQPAKFNLVINLRTAKALGLKVPQAVLARADRVIE
jgi:putative ABC transport system substrate-binding protein